MFEHIGPDIAGHITFTIIALSFMVKDMLWLRSLSITASCFSFIYNYFGPSQPMWVAISWNCFFMSLNIYHVFNILRERRDIELSPKEKEVHDSVFRSLSKSDFLKILKMGKWIQKAKNDILISEGQKVEKMELIYKGRVRIVVNQHKIAELEDLKFIGEISFLTQHPASATVVVEEDCEMLMWDQESLREMLKKAPQLLSCLQAAIGLQISDQMSKQNQKLAA